jgi:hypothetical protein
LVTILILGAFAGIGITTYRIGYQQGAQGAGVVVSLPFARFDWFAGNRRSVPDNLPQFIPRMNGHSFKHGFGLGFSNNHLAMMNRGRGFGFFPPFQFLFLMVILGLFIWFGYRLFKGNGWQLSLTRQPENPDLSEASTPKNEPARSNE